MELYYRPVGKRFHQSFLSGQFWHALLDVIIDTVYPGGVACTHGLPLMCFGAKVRIQKG